MKIKKNNQCENLRDIAPECYIIEQIQKSTRYHKYFNLIKFKLLTFVNMFYIM